MFKITKHILCIAITYGMCGCVLESSDIDKITNDPSILVYCPNDSDKAELDFIQITKAADEEHEGSLCANEECISKNNCCGLSGKYAEKYFLAFHHKICPENMNCQTENNHYFCGIQQLECSSEQIKCNNVCANLKTDMKHCGSCNSPCESHNFPDAQTVACISGICSIVDCITGYQKSNDNQSCTKGNDLPCDIKQCENNLGWKSGTCQNGQCVATQCEEDFHIFNDKNEDGTYFPCEKDSTLRCGEPYQSCTLPENALKNKCRDGKCQIAACKEGYHITLDSNECEQDTIFACGNSLNDCYAYTAWGDGDDDHEDNDGSCNQGNCYANTCEDGYHTYNQIVEDKFIPCQKDDADNCGAHNHKCEEPTPLCQNGKCIEKCSGNMTLCTAGCVNLSTDVDNCTACGNKCPEKTNMNVTCNDGCKYTCKAGFDDCDQDSNNGCETLLTDKHWSKCGICEKGYNDCDNKAENGCEIKYSDYGLETCTSCTESYTNCGPYVHNKTIVSCLKPGKGWDDQSTPFAKFCNDRCNNTKDPLTYTTSEAIHHPSVCKPKQYCARIDDPYPHYRYPCTNQK